MVKDVYFGNTLRKSFARKQEITEMPGLLDIQKKSYRWFLETGLREVFKDVGSISDYAGNLELSFIDFSMKEKPKYNVETCKARDATYAAPIKVKVRLRNKETDEIKEQEIFMGDFPLMTEGATFVINGAERVIVSQIVRSPGMYYNMEADKAGNISYSATVIPYRGAWLEYETDSSDVFWVRIDKNRKILHHLPHARHRPEDRRRDQGSVRRERLIQNTLEKEAELFSKDLGNHTPYEFAMLEIYRKLRPGEPPTVDSCESPHAVPALLTPAVMTCPPLAVTVQQEAGHRQPPDQSDPGRPPLVDPWTGEIWPMSARPSPGNGQRAG